MENVFLLLAAKHFKMTTAFFRYVLVAVLFLCLSTNSNAQTLTPTLVTSAGTISNPLTYITDGNTSTGCSSRSTAINVQASLTVDLTFVTPANLSSVWPNVSFVGENSTITVSLLNESGGTIAEILKQTFSGQMNQTYNSSIAGSWIGVKTIRVLVTSIAATTQSIVTINEVTATVCSSSATKNLATAGSLSGSLTACEKQCSNLSLTGNIDARDFKTMRDDMPNLTTVDLSGATIVAYTGTAGTAGTTTYPANEIPQSGLSNSKFTSITFPSTITAIGQSACANASLSAVTIPYAVTSIGAHAFQNTALKAITIPASVTSIGNYAFSETDAAFTVDAANTVFSSLNTVLYSKDQTVLLQAPISISGSFNVPASVKTIGIGAFMSCAKLTGIVFPASSAISTISKQAFYMCSGLGSVTIPASVSSIGEIAFSGSSATFVVQPQNANYTSVSGILYNKTVTELIQASTSVTNNVSVPNTVTTIDIGAFWNASGLKSIVLPASVRSINSKAFYNCSALMNIISKNPTPIGLVGDSWFISVPTTATLYVPIGTKAAYQASSWSAFTTIKEMDVVNKPTNTALSFDGIDDGVVAPLATTKLDNVTIEAWVNYAGNKNYAQMIIVNGSSAASGYSLYVETDGTLNGLCGGVAFMTSSYKLPENQWTHVALARDATTWHLYVNGNELAIGNKGTAPKSIAATDSLFIGCTNGGAQVFNGKIDEVRVWETFKSESAIQSTMYSYISNPETTANLVAYYNCNNGIANGVNTDVTMLLDASKNKKNAKLQKFALIGTTSNFVPRNDMLVYYPFNSNANDESGNGNNITVTTTASLGADRFGEANKAFTFNGTSQYFEKSMTSIGTLAPNSMSVCAWVKTKSTAPSQCIVGQPRNTTQTGFSLMIDNGKPGFGRANSSGMNESVSSLTIINDDKWHLVIGTYDISTGKYCIYIDGSLQNTYLSTIKKTLDASTQPLFIGKEFASSRYFNGSIDEVRIYNQCLNVEDVADLYRQTIPTFSVSTTNNALDFDGTGDYISLPSNNLTKTTFTAESWVYLRSFTDFVRFLDFGVTGALSDNIMCGLGHYLTERGKPFIGVSTGNANVIAYIANKQIPLNEWVHMAYVINDKSAKIYMNGSPVMDTVMSAPFTINVNRKYNFIGSSNWPGEPTVNAKLDEVRLWSTARTQAEIMANMNLSLTAGTGLLASYTFDQGVPYAKNSETLKSVGFTGTLNGFAQEGTTSNWVPGAPVQNPSVSSTLSLAKTAGSTGYASVAASGAWTSTSNANWLTVAPNSASGNTELKIVALTANPTTVARTANVVITSGANTHTIAVTQAAGDPTLAVSTTNNALAFEAAKSNYVDCGIINPFQFTVEAWVNLNTIGTIQVIASKLINEQNYYNKNFELRVDADGAVHFCTPAGNQWDEFVTATKLVAKQWYHIAATCDGTTSKLYINGNFEASMTLPSSYVSTQTKMLIGARPTLTNTDGMFFNGSIDEVRLWNIARPQDSIIANMNKSLPVRSNLVANYNFNQGIANGVNPTDTTLKTSSGSVNGVLSKSFALSGTTSNWTTGAPLIYPTDPAKIAIAHQATTAYAEVTANVVWTATSNQTWLTLTANAANGSLALAASANPSLQTRTATVTLTADTISRTITVDQAGIPADDNSVDHCVVNTTSGVANYVEVPANPTAYNFADNNCTFEFWFKASDLTGRRELFNWKLNNDDFGLFINNVKKLQVFLKNPNFENANFVADIIETNKWYHAAIVCAGTNLKVYLNGVAVIDKPINGTMQLTNLKNTNIKLGINDNSLNEAFVGKFDEFRIWKTARTDEQIKDNMHYRLDAQDNLVGLFHFDEATGSELFDYSATNNHALLKGSESRVVSNAQITPLMAMALSNSSCSILAGWNLMPLATKYIIELSSNTSFTGAITKTLPVSPSYCVFSGLEPNTTYYIRIHGERDNEGTVGDTIVTSATTLALPTFTVTQPSTSSLGSITVTSPTTDVTYGITIDPTSTSSTITGLKRGAYPVYVKYNDDVTCIVKAVDSARINAKPLTATAEVETTKVYDGDTVAKIISSVLNNKESNDDVTVSATARYSDALVGKNKKITVRYSISGTNKDNYIAPKDSVISVGVITQRKLTIDASISKVYDGTTDAMNAVKITALKDTVKGDKVSVIVNSATYLDKNAGTNKSVVLQLGVNGAQALQYSITDTTITTASIDKAQLIVRAKNITISVNENKPPLTYSYSGFVNGETETDINQSPSVTCPDFSSSVGTYVIYVNPQTNVQNYNVIGENGILSVTGKSVPNISWNISSALNYGEVFSPNSSASENHTGISGTFTYYEDTQNIIGQVLSAGKHTVIAKFVPYYSNVYEIVTDKFDVFVSKAPLNITVKPTTIEYGTTPQFQYTVLTPFVNNETDTVLKGTVQYQYPTNPPVGKHLVTIRGLSASNYDITFISDSLTVTQATLTVTAPTITMVQGEKIPSYQLMYAGFKYKDTITSLTKIPVITIADSTTVDTTILTPAGGISDNYTFNPVLGSLIVKKATLTLDSSNVTFAVASQLKDSVRVRANTKWNFAPASNSWLTVTRSKDSILYFVADTNKVNTSRSSSVVLSTVGGFASQTIMVTQAAAILNTTAFTKLADSVEKIVKTASIGAGHLQYKATDTAALWSALRSLRIQFTKDSTQAMLTATTAKLNDSLSIFTRNQNHVSFTVLRDSLAQIKTLLVTLPIGTDACQYSPTLKAKLTTDSTAARESIGKLGITAVSVQALIDTLAADSKRLRVSRVGEAQKKSLQESIALANKYVNDSTANYSTANIQLLRTVLNTANVIQYNACASQHVVDSMQHALSDSIQSLIARKIIRLAVSEKKISYSAAEQKTNVQLTSNHTWKVVTDNKTWLKVDTTANSSFENAKEVLQWAGNKTLVVYAQSNTTKAERTANITVTSGDSTKIITVVQDANIVTSAREAITTNLNEIIPQYEYASLFSYAGKSPIIYGVASSNADVASVSLLSKGFKILANTNGTATITVTASTAMGTQASTNFTVTVQTPVCALHLDSTITAVACAGANTGAISVTITGGAVPYVYRWTDLPSSTNKIDKLIAGIYSLLVVDSLGCSLKRSFVVPEAQAIQINEMIIPSSCNTSDGAIALSVVGGAGGYTYSWSDNSTNDSLLKKPAGKYSVMVSDKAACTKTATFSISDHNAPKIVIDSIVPTLCKQKLGKIVISVAGGTEPYTYKWMDNQTVEDRLGLSPGKYVLTVSDAASCNAVIEATVNAPEINQPQLALVTIDSASQKPLVVWLREKTNAIDYYTIYRDGQKIAERPYDSLSVYWDNDATIDTKSEAYSYTITASNACGTTTDKSYAFRTILLTRTRDAFDSNVITLDWDNYEGTNFDRTYSIYRQKDGKWDQWKKVVNKNRVIDNDATGVTNYYVAVDLNDTIHPSMFKTDTGPFSQSMSNMSEASLVSEPEIAVVNHSAHLVVYPNPANDMLSIQVNNASIVGDVLVLASDAVSYSILPAATNNELHSVSINHLASGVYTLAVPTDKGILYQKLVIIK